MWFAITKEATMQRYMKISIIVYFKVLRMYFIHKRVWRLNIESEVHSDGFYTVKNITNVTGYNYYINYICYIYH